MIDLALQNLYLLGAALAIGIVTGRWAFSFRKAASPETPTNKEDDSRS
ncbi:hypothetical protein [Allosphingosinicella sp.]